MLNGGQAFVATDLLLLCISFYNCSLLLICCGLDMMHVGQAFVTKSFELEISSCALMNCMPSSRWALHLMGFVGKFSCQ